MSEYDGPERRRDMDNIERLLDGLKELFNLKFDQIEKQLNDLKEDLKKFEKRLDDVESAPARKAEENQTGFLRVGKDLASKAVWGAFFAFIGFLVLNYIKVL